MSAKTRYNKLDSKRQTPLNRARQCAKLTIPAIMPPDGHSQGSTLPTPYQSLGARGVNNLASKLLLALLPANSSFFRLTIPEDVLEELGAAKTDAETALQSIERRVLKRIETSNARVTLFEAFKHLIVTGNGLIYVPKDDGLKFYSMAQYCVLRDGQGTVVEAVLKESVHPEGLSDEVREKCKVKTDSNGNDDVDIYTIIKLKDGMHEWHQEINDIKVPDSESKVKAKESPWLFLRWQAVANEDYGRGLVEEYLGDMISLEELSKAITAFSAIAAKILFLLHPNAQTDEEDMKDAETGDVIIGSIEDIDVLQLDKFQDFRVAKEQIDDLTLRLSHAFLLTSGTVRDAERVTAEEVRMQAQELEDVLGGVYTVQSQELQLPLVTRLMSVMQKAGEIPTLPKDTVEPMITTGFDALGRGHDLNKMRQFLGDVQAVLGDEAMAYFNMEVLLKKLSTGHGIDTSELLKTEQQVQQERQQTIQTQMASEAIPKVAQEATKGMVKQQQ